MIDRSAWRFFLENAGWNAPTGRVKAAAELARAEAEGRSRGWYVAWRDEEECVCADDDVTCRCDRARVWNAEHCWPDLEERTCFCSGAILMDREPEWVDEQDAEWLSSLWGICEPDEAYRRVVAAELMAEALAPSWAELERWDAFLRRVVERKVA